MLQNVSLLIIAMALIKVFLCFIKKSLTHDLLLGKITEPNKLREVILEA